MLSTEESNIKSALEDCQATGSPDYMWSCLVTVFLRAGQAKCYNRRLRNMRNH